MMKRHLTFCAVLFTLHAIHAATAIPAAASNYVFSTPLRPAHIRGLVMGSPPAYYVPRSEDIDWLNEALRERRAYMSGGLPDGTNTTLAASFGKWELSETNRFYRWVTAVDAAGVTNVVVGYNLVTNTPPTSGSPMAKTGDSYWPFGDAAEELWNPPGNPYGYLDPDVPLTTGAHAYDGSEVWTNIYTLAGYTNGVTNAFSTISVTMTNGTLSVHTNMWHAYRRLPCVIVYTNVIEASAIHFCHFGGGPFPGYTNAPPVALYSRHLYTRFAVPAAVSNDYAALRGATRLADMIDAPANAPASKTDSEHSHGEWYTNWVYETREAAVPQPWTNTTSNVSTNLTASDWCYYLFYRENNVRETTVEYKVWDENHEFYDYETITGTEYTISSEETGRHSDTAVLSTRFRSNLATAGGAMRVEVEAIYAAVRFLYDNYSLTNYADHVVIDTNVVLRLSGPVLDVSGTNAAVKVLLDSRAICETAAAAAGAPSLPSSLSGNPGAGRGESWFVTRGGFVIIYRVMPQSRLSNW